MKAWSRIAALGVMLLAAVPGARAQETRTIRVTGEPMLIASQSDHAPSQRPVAPLTPSQSNRLRSAQSFREGRMYDRARELLATLDGEVPHHPLIVTEMARLSLIRQDWSAVERLGRTERAFLHDSLLLAREMAVAYEQLKRPKDAAQVVLEAWTVAPAEGQWATAMILHLASIDPKAVREIMQRFADRAPQRFDMLQGLAELQWQMGDQQAALKLLASADHTSKESALRVGFAGDLLDHGVAYDSTGAIKVLLDVAGDPAVDSGVRVASGYRAWQIHTLRLSTTEGAPAIAHALKDVPTTRWPPDMLSGVVRGLRQAGLTTEARALLKSRGSEGQLPPDLALEHSLADLRDGPPERALESLRQTMNASPDGPFFYAEALFYAGFSDSALALYKTIADNPQGAYAGAALERIYLIEDAKSKEALASFGRIAYETWRGQDKRAESLCDSLYHALPQGPIWAQAALELATLREALGNPKGALEPLLAVADGLPDDRLAPRARQRAGDIYLVALKDEAKAAEQYEECLARYPRAWNAPEIRRKLDGLRREKRF